jgi:hypothetical protein
MMMSFEKIFSLIFAKTRFGTINMIIGVHDGKPKYLLTNENISKKFKSANSTQEAVEFGLSMLANDRKTAKSGTLTITYELSQGEVKKLHVMRQMKVYFSDC